MVSPNYQVPGRAAIPNATVIEGAGRLMEFANGLKGEQLTPEDAEKRKHEQVMRDQRERQATALADKAVFGRQTAAHNAAKAHHLLLMKIDPVYAAAQRKANRREGQKQRDRENEQSPTRPSPSGTPNVQAAANQGNAAPTGAAAVSTPPPDDSSNDDGRKFDDSVLPGFEGSLDDWSKKHGSTAL